jgi:hypothetical protein
VGEGLPGYFGHAGERTARSRWDYTGPATPDVRAEIGWPAFEEAFAPAYDVAREYAKYRWYWDQRTIWLGTHSELRGTPLYEQRRETRRGMTERWNELRMAFHEHAEIVLNHATYLGTEFYPEIHERYGLDYSVSRHTIDSYHHQWRNLLIWNTDPVPF